MEEIVDKLIGSELGLLRHAGIISVQKINLKGINLDSDLFAFELEYEISVFRVVGKRIYIAHRTLPGIVASIAAFNGVYSDNYLGELSFIIEQVRRFSRPCDLRAIRKEMYKTTGIYVKLGLVEQSAYANLAYNWEDKYWYFIDRKGNIIKYNKHGK